jgi:ectoine hydroxylase-related dioxygenase (phytanoyl-CoA dioxygenase family)
VQSPFNSHILTLMIMTQTIPCKPELPLVDAAAGRALDRDGYAILTGVLDAATRRSLNQRIAELVVAEGALAGIEVHQEAGTSRLANLVDKGACFRACLADPRVLACVDHVLAGDWRLSALNYRSALPGAGGQALHADWGGAVQAGDWQVCNSVWLLDDFSVHNGATRVVPGSHRWGSTPGEALPDPAARHPDEVVVEAPAGSVVVFNSHLWHGGTLNRSLLPRRALFAYFTRRNQPQQTDQRRSLSESTVATLTPAERWIADV